MKEVLIACLMMEAETKNALEVTGSKAEVIWMEKGLHNRPEELRDALQKTIDQAERDLAPDRILLGYGFCGNAVQGLRARSCQLILPRIDDCITMFIGSRERKAALEGGVGIMFQTCNWADGDKNLRELHDKLYEDYDEDDADDLWEMMYGKYKRIGVLDTHCYDLEPVVAEARETAKALNFECMVIDASNDYLRELLSGPWSDERFIVKEPGEIISGPDLWM